MNPENPTRMKNDDRYTYLLTEYNILIIRVI